MHARSIEEVCLKYSKAEPYKVSNVTVAFEYEGESELKSYITTPRLELESTSIEHTNHYVEMTSNSNAMKLYGTGNPWLEEYTRQRVSRWNDDWKKNNPFSSFAVYTKEGEQFVGHVALDYDETTPKNCAEISYIMKLESWGQGYGSEAVWSVVNPYAETISRKYKCQGESFEGVYATARPDNFSSLSILLKSGMELQQKDFKPMQTKWGERVSFFKKLPLALDATSIPTAENTVTTLAVKI